MLGIQTSASLSTRSSIKIVDFDNENIFIAFWTKGTPYTIHCKNLHEGFVSLKKNIL